LTKKYEDKRGETENFARAYQNRVSQNGDVRTDFIRTDFIRTDFIRTEFVRQRYISSCKDCIPRAELLEQFGRTL
jgi:hypothetical protein